MTFLTLQLLGTPGLLLSQFYIVFLYICEHDALDSLDMATMSSWGKVVCYSSARYKYMVAHAWLNHAGYLIET